jgi:hypothetical protein
MLFNLVHFNQ